MRNSYIVIPRVISSDLVKEIDNYFDTILSSVEEGVQISGLEISLDVDKNVVGFKLKSAGRLFPKINHIGDRDFLGDAIKDEWGNNLNLIPAHELLYRSAISGPGTPWHQDEGFMKPLPGGEPYQRVTAWIAIKDVDKDGGCPQYVETSGVGPLYPHALTPEPGMVDDSFIIESTAIPLRAGDASAHHCRTLHMTGPNVSEIERRTLLVRYSAI